MSGSGSCTQDTASESELHCALDTLQAKVSCTARRTHCRRSELHCALDTL
uniref:Uncharacterized protein n=1 Tax=Anguilla anguilla TaxID=7936 RepID=A0A0E9Q162_ANGAN